MHTNNKRQKITEAMSLLDDEKESLSSNTYVQVAEGLADRYKTVEDLYVLKWMSIVPVVLPDDESGDRVVYKQTPCKSILPLTLDQVGRINRMIQCGTSYACFTDTVFWDNMDYLVPLFGHHLRIDGATEDTNISQTSVLLSLVEFEYKA